MRSLSSGQTRATTTPSRSTSAPSSCLVGRAGRRRRATGCVRRPQPDLAGDRRGRRRVVAGDHRDADPGAAAGGDRVARRSGRGGSSKADEAEQLEVPLDVVGRRRRPSAATGARDGERAPAAPRRTGRRAAVGRRRCVDAAREHGVRAPLTESTPSVRAPTCGGGAGRTGSRRVGGAPSGGAARSAGRATSSAASIGSPTARQRARRRVGSRARRAAPRGAASWRSRRAASPVDGVDGRRRVVARCRRSPPPRPPASRPRRPSSRCASASRSCRCR